MYGFFDLYLTVLSKKTLRKNVTIMHCDPITKSFFITNSQYDPEIIFFGFRLKVTVSKSTCLEIRIKKLMIHGVMNEISN